MIKRNIKKQLLQDLEKKIVFVTGPRQAGKTTLSRSLFPNDDDYLNYDRPEHRLMLKASSWDRKKLLQNDSAR